VFAIDNDNAREAEIHSGAEEGGCDGKADEVDEEVVACGIKGVLVEKNASDVANGFADEAEEHCGHVAPCFVTGAKVEVGDDVDAEDGGVEGVAAEGGDIVEVREGEVAGCDVAEGVVVFEEGDVAVAGVVVPVEAGNAIGGDEEGLDAVEKDGEGSVRVNCDV